MKGLTATVLIIEDDAWLAGHYSRTLRQAGFETRHAGDALAGIAAIDELMPDVIVLDVFLPGPNALVLLHEMQSHADLSAIPVIVCTNNPIVLSPDSLEAYGVRQVIDKGEMRPDDLVAAIRRVLL